MRAEANGLSFTPVLRVGQTIEQVELLAESLRQSLGAWRIRVTPNAARTLCRVDLMMHDPLMSPVPLPLLGASSASEIELGRTEHGEPWRLPIGPHTLVCGCSGSGKASLAWGVLRGLAPAIRSGAVEIHGIDLKGGMELGFGQEMLTRYARTAPEAVQLLEDAAEQLQSRAIRLAGITRQHVPSPASPLVVVLIDELASITAYLPDRDMSRRANAALSIILSQGRAVGYSVVACLQDPRKEVIPARGLFLRTVGLRLRDRVETQMVLGDGAVEAGARCDRIPASMPGTAYVASAEGGLPLRVRAAFVSDDEIRRLAMDYPALRPTQVRVSTVNEPRRQGMSTRKGSR